MYVCQFYFEVRVFDLQVYISAAAAVSILGASAEPSQQRPPQLRRSSPFKDTD